ncbi:FMRFamide receptor [Lingula anatina]|uniref:FMRFamide receptor n=1 Tax=Lingula anatina TaxID=7574 RepID=A0A1S3HTA8_LINAN|nr:FMRFamide receptor [Lingula anatina]|eukprot:XP_013388786.1 FMRFamide receptor [Lingula anatina]
MENATVFPDFNSSVLFEGFLTDNSSVDNNSTICPDNVWDPTRATTVFWTNSVIGFGFIIFGICGNALSIIVLSRERPLTTTSILLQGVAVSDSLYLLSNLFYVVFIGINKYTGQMRWYLRALHPLLMPYVKPLMYISQQASVWLIVLVTLDRHYVITNPIQAATNPRTKRTQLKVVAVFFLTIAYNIPHFFELDLVPCKYPDGENGHIMMNSELGNSMVYFLVYGIGFYFITMYIVPMLILAIVNMKLIWTLRRAAKQRVNLAEVKGKSGRDDVTFVLVVVVFVFVACQTPDFLLQIYYFELVIVGSFKMTRFGANLFGQIVTLLLIINASVNFIIYCLWGNRFRQDMLKLFRCGKGNGKKGSISNKTASTKINRHNSSGKEVQGREKCKRPLANDNTKL